MEISQLRSGWCWLNKIIRPGGTMEDVRRIPMSLQDIDFIGDAPDTMCLANFRLSLWDEAASGAPERFAFRQAANIAQAFGHDAAGGGRNINANSVTQFFKEAAGISGKNF
jgi:hypothetical protein